MAVLCSAIWLIEQDFDHHFNKNAYEKTHPRFKVIADLR